MVAGSMGNATGHIYMGFAQGALLRAAALRLCAMVLALLIATPAIAQSEPLDLEPHEEHWSLLSALEISQSVPAGSTFEEVRSGAFDASFTRGDGEVPNLDGEDGAIWVRASLRNTGDEAVETQVVLKYPQPRSIDFFVEGDNGRFRHVVRGSAQAVEAPFAGRFPHARLAIPAGETRAVYLRLESVGPVLIPLQVFRAEHFGEAMAFDYLVFGVLIGCLLAIAVHSGLTFSATREPAFGWFVLFAIGGAGFILTGTGMAKALIYPASEFHSTAVLMAAQGLANMAAALFLASYLRLRERAPRMRRVILVLAAIALAGSFSSLLPEPFGSILVATSVLVGPTVLFGTNLWLAIKGIVGARTLLVGWCFVQAGTVWICLRAFDIVPYTEVNHYALPLAITFTALHFSWALTARARRAEHRAVHDTLTGLPNRFRLETIAQESGRVSDRFAAVLQVDLDGFKSVNDTLGHAAGDHVLKTVAERIAGAVEKEARVFRLGGDEFVVLVPKKRKPANIVALANRVIIAASRPITFRDEQAHVGASVGIAIPHDEDAHLSAVMERADGALYDAKRAGKGRVNFCDLATEREVLAQAVGSQDSAQGQLDLSDATDSLPASEGDKQDGNDSRRAAA